MRPGHLLEHQLLANLLIEAILSKVLILLFKLIDLFLKAFIVFLKYLIQGYQLIFIFELLF